MRHKKPENWLAALARNGHGIQEEIPVSPSEAASEALLMGLRLREGVPLAHLDDILNDIAVDRLTTQGLLMRTKDRLKVMPEGMLVLDASLAEIVR